MKKLKINKNMLLLLAMLIATMIMGIGYASIESVTGEIEGKVIADVQEGVFITDVEYVSDIDANINNCKINNFLGTMLNSTIELSKANLNSEIKYKVTVYNSSDETVPFVGVVYDDDFYDNSDIAFDITTDGLQIGQTIAPGETKEVYITFKYKNTTTETVPENTVLKSYLNFKMAEPNRMVLANDIDSTGKYLTSSITKNQIESIKFIRGKEILDGSEIEIFDASEKQDESIIGYYTDEDNDGLYELTFASQELIYANKNAQCLFYDLINLEDIDLSNFYTKGVTNFYRMFKNCEKLTNIDLSGFDTSDAISMSVMFYGCNSLQELDLSGFNTNKVKNMSFMFSYCESLPELNLDNFNTTHVETMYDMFYGCELISKLDLTKFDTGNVANMGGMFGHCINLVKLDISSFNTSKVENMDGMFSVCKRLEILKLDNFDTSNVTNMKSMFNMCENITELDISSFNTENVTNMRAMFYECNKLKNIDVSSFNTKNVTTMQNMFYRCIELTKLNLANFDTIMVENMNGMFGGCGELLEVDVSEYDEQNKTGWTTINVTDSDKMFDWCQKLIGGNNTKFDSNYTDATYARIDTAETPGYFTNIKDKIKETESVE